MKKILLLGLMGLMGLMGLRAQGQAVGCDDTVRWGTALSFEGSKCCWAVLEGPTDCFYSSYNQIDCNYDTLADHRFLSPWVEVPSFAATDSVVLIYATEVSCTAEYSVAVTTDGVTYDTLRHRLVDAYQHDTILLGAYAGQVIRIQFCHYGLNSTFDPYAAGCSYAADYHWQLLFSALQWRSLVYPVVSWWVPAKAYVGETTWLRASLADGSSTGLTYTWHSSLTGQTLTGDTVGLTYTAGGEDTLTLITTNAYGSDTLTQTVTVVDCGGVVTAHPWKVDFLNEYDCWRTVGTVGWSYAGRYISGNTYYGIYAAHNNGGANIIASPAVVLPADSTGLRLYWKDSRLSSGTSTYYVLVSTTSRYDITEYDTIFTCTSQTSNVTQRSVSLADYAGDTIYIAFCKMLQNGRTVFITDVQMYNALAPIGTLEAPAVAVATGDSVQCTVHLAQGDSLTYSWHSVLLDSTIVTTDSVLTIVYPEAGSETLTVTASNAHGTLELSKSYNVYTCNVVNTYPWEEDFSDAGGSYNVCWAIDGYSHNAPNSGYGGHDEETDVVWSFNNCMISSTSGSYMITPALAIPAGETNIAFMVEYMTGTMDIRVSPTASTDTAQFTDLLLTEPNTYNIKRRWVNLGAYAGQTIRVALVTSNPNSQSVNRVWVGIDTLPYIGNKVSVPAKIHSDSTALCTVALYHGATDGLHYTWTSAVGGIITTNALGDSAWVSYGAGFSSTEDTLTVVAVNAFGADTVQKPLHIIDCTPALTLPWKETFADGLVCWYKPEGSKFVDVIPYNMSSYEYMRHLYLNAKLDTAGSWLMSKEIHIPADTTLSPRLFWKVASSNGNYQHLYSVLVTTAVDYTDTANYTVLYTDSSTHVNFSNYDLRSVDLTPYAGQSIHVAFHNHGNHLPTSSVSLYIDDVEIRSSQVPVVSLSAPGTVNSHTPVTFTATLVEGSSTGLTYTWHSTLMDSTMVTTAPALTMTYTLGGNDTLRVIASNAYGADTATATVAVTDCTPIAALPWMEDFNSVAAVAYNAANGKVPNCWNRYWNGSDAKYTPHVIGSYLNQTAVHTYTQSNNALLLQAGTSSGYDSVAMVESPAFDVPLNGQLLSFYYMHESASYGTLSVGYLQDGVFVGVADMEPQATGRTDTVSLQAIPAGVNRIALHWKKTGTWYGVIVDNLRVFARDTLPTVRIQAPAQVFVGDPATLRAAMVNGLTDGLTYTWHSSLTGSTWSGTDEWNVTYSVGGYDTVSVVAANAYGADTAVAVVYVDSHPLPQVTLTAPTSVYVGDSVTISVTLNDCSTNGLAMTLHSSLLDTTMTLNSSLITLNYTAGGTDTVTLIVSNAYGADTVEAYIYAVDCSNATLPYVETFEGVSPIPWNTRGQNSLPLCWQMAYNGTNANIHQPTVVSSYQFISNLPDQALLLMAGSSGYATWVQAELPLFNAPLSSLAIALDYRYESANAGTLTVGYVDDTLGYIPVDTLAPHAGSYTRDSIYFADAATAGNARIALRYAYNSSFYAVVIDNIEVFSNNGILAPESLVAENITATCATLRWSEVDTATAYRVTLSGAMNIDTVVTDTTLTLCGLMDDADYSVTVVPLVGSDAGRRISTTFHTLMLCAPLANVSISPEGIISWQYDTAVAEQSPAGVEIEVIDQQGQVLVLTDTAYFSPYVAAGLTPGHTYSFAVRTLCASATANTADTVVTQVAPSVCAEAASNTIPSNSHFMDNFWESNYSQVIYPASFAAGIDTLYGIALRVAQYEPYSWQTTSGTCRYDIYVGQTNGTHTSPLTSDSLTMVVQNKHYSLSGTGWHNFVFDTPYIYDGTGNLVVTIVSRQSNTVYDPVYGVHTDATCTHFVQDADHGSSNINPSTFNFQWETNTNIPDIRLLGGCGGSTNTCLAPETEVVAVDTHSVSLQWAQRGSESLWQVEYRPVSASAWQVADTTSATSFTITGLAQATHYVVRAGAVCNDSLVVYGFPDSATTLCGYMELPYTISFLADEYPCWTLGSNLYHNNWNGVTLSEWNTNGFLVSPEVNANIADLRATITSLRPIAESYESRFAVGVGNADGSNVTWIDTIGFLQQNTVQTNEVHFNHYTGSGRHIILRGVEGTCYIRQFTLEAFAGCVPVHDVTVDSIGEHSAQLTWVPEVATHTWAVYLDGALVATTSTPSYTLTGLNSNTQYTVGVSEICGAGDTSTAVTRLFRTRCDAFALPYFEEFDQAPEIGNDHILTDCWILHAAGNYATAYCIGDQWSYTCLQFYDNNEGYDVVNYLSSPSLTVGAGGALVAFKGQTTYFDTFTVGIMLTPYDTSTFIPVREITVSSGGMAWYSFSTDTIAGAPTSGTFTVAFRFTGEGQGLIDSLTVTANPVPTHDLALAVNDTAMGTVSGAGTYDEGTMVTVSATPKPGYRFVQWSDGIIAATRQVKMDTDLSLTAYFEAMPCLVPTDLAAEVGDVEWTGERYVCDVTLRWTPGGDEQQWEIRVDADTDFPEQTFTATDTFYVIDNMDDDGCTHTFQVRALCANGEYGDWSATQQFALPIIGIDDVESTAWSLYPNPASGSVTISAAAAAELTIHDLQGREVLRTSIGSGATTVDISRLSQGVYFVRLGAGVKKLVVR